MDVLAPLTAADGAKLYATFAPAKGKMKAALHLNHGMGEHSGRYGETVEALTAAGYAVLAHHHRGHGGTAELNSHTLGHMTADGATMETWVSDMGVARAALLERVGDVPLILFGHSMGSFFAKRAAQAHPDWYQALILSGTIGRPGLKQRLSAYIPKIEALVRGGDKPARTFHELTFQEFNRPFKADNSRQAWLSRDPEVWAAYAADPWCDFVVYTKSYAEVSRMIRANFSEEGLAGLSRSAPTLLFGGTRDALSDMGVALQGLYEEWAALGLEDLSLKLWEGGRHETLNETNSQEVIAHMIAWLDARFS